MKYDYLIVGSGLYGAVFAHEAKKAGKSVLVIDKRPEFDALAEKVVYTGSIDAYFGFSLGTLEYRSVRFVHNFLLA